MEALMGDLFFLSAAQMARISHHFPLSHGVPRVDDRRVVSGIVYVSKHSLQWKNAPSRLLKTPRSAGIDVILRFRQGGLKCVAGTNGLGRCSAMWASRRALSRIRCG
ncbi:MAG: transposase [Hyphomicrobiales bacterium]|nr:MAG: transposase [Hyphomicrobiales bacterium]